MDDQYATAHENPLSFEQISPTQSRFGPALTQATATAIDAAGLSDCQFRLLAKPRHVKLPVWLHLRTADEHRFWLGATNELLTALCLPYALRSPRLAPIDWRERIAEIDESTLTQLVNALLAALEFNETVSIAERLTNQPEGLPADWLDFWFADPRIGGDGQWRFDRNGQIAQKFADVLALLPTLADEPIAGRTAFTARIVLSDLNSDKLDLSQLAFGDIFVLGDTDTRIRLRCANDSEATAIVDWQRMSLRQCTPFSPAASDSKNRVEFSAGAVRMRTQSPNAWYPLPVGFRDKVRIARAGGTIAFGRQVLTDDGRHAVRIERVVGADHR